MVTPRRKSARPTIYLVVSCISDGFRGDLPVDLLRSVNVHFCLGEEMW